MIEIWERDIDSGVFDCIEVPDEIMLGKPPGPSQEECDFLADIFRTQKKRLNEIAQQDVEKIEVNPVKGVNREKSC